MTYEIIHLSKYTIFIQYIEHLGTLDELLLLNIGKKESSRLIEIHKSLHEEKKKKLLDQYDKYERMPIKYQLEEVLLGGSANMRLWWTKYTNFVRTYAQWAYIGYVIGLGDRHTNNILVKSDGKIIHIDFEYIFDAGKILPFPEWVPFRFTRALRDFMSSIAPYGLFYAEFVKTAHHYQQNRRKFWRALSNFSYFKKKFIVSSLCERADMKPNVHGRCFHLIE